MTDAEMQALINEGDSIDHGAQAHAEAAAEGRLDPSGNILEPDPDAAAREWFMIPKVLAWAITAVFPETAPAYTDEKCMDLARDIAPVAEKYGLSGIGDSPELTLLVGTGLFCMPGYLAYSGRKAAQAQAAAEQRANTPGEMLDKASQRPADGG